MTRSQRNYLEMTQSVGVLFGSRTAVWENQPVVRESLDQVTHFCGQVKHEATLQEKNDTKGHTAATDQSRTQLEDMMFRVGRRVNVYAIRNDDSVAKSASGFSRSKLDHLSMQMLLTKARALLSTASSLLPTLNRYQVTQNELDALQQAIDATERLNAHRNAVGGEHAGNTTQLESLFASLKSEIKVLDSAVTGYIDDEEFLQTYFITRRIHDIRGGRPPKKSDQ